MFSRARRPLHLLVSAFLLAGPLACRPIDRCCDADDFVDLTAPLNPQNEAGIVLSFDDAYVDHWYELLPLLEQYGAKATFFVTRFDYLDDYQVEELRALEAMGNEIGCHSHRHLPAGQYSRQHSAEEWIEEDILPSLDAFHAQGFDPVSFAFPFGEHTQETAEAALGYFTHLRGSYYVGRVLHVPWVDSVFIPAEELPQRPFSCSFAIDHKYGVSEADIARGLDRAMENNEVMALYAHNPIAEPVEPYDVSLRLVEQVLKGASERGLRFYTYREFQAAQE